jgi:hypothetical protein
MTAKEFYDHITKHMTAEQALLKLLEGQVMEYEKLKFSSDENSIHPVLLIAMAAMDMGWNMAIPNPKDDPDADLTGMIVGTQEYIDSVLKEDDNDFRDKEEN